jgi:hypothetical protein
MQERWGKQLGRDPFYNPNLSLELARIHDGDSVPALTRPVVEARILHHRESWPRVHPSRDSNFEFDESSDSSSLNRSLLVNVSSPGPCKA